MLLGLELLEARHDNGFCLCLALPALDFHPFARLEILVVLEEVLDLFANVLGDVVKSCRWAQRGSFVRTAMTFASEPPSSVMLKTAIGRTFMPTPG